jgi:hypothetical protein
LETCPTGWDRTDFTPIEQALFGRRDLTFGAAVYRPERAGWNSPEDVALLARYLEGIDPQAWQTGDLAGLPEAGEEEDAVEELAWARAGLAALRDLYQRCRDAGRMLVLEQVHG